MWYSANGNVMSIIGFYLLLPIEFQSLSRVSAFNADLLNFGSSWLVWSGPHEKTYWIEKPLLYGGAYMSVDGLLSLM